MAPATRLLLIAYPKGDRTFAEVAARHVAEGVDKPGELEYRLRAEWPNTRVIEGITDAEAVRWYVYRDGRWVPD